MKNKALKMKANQAFILFQEKLSLSRPYCSWRIFHR